MVEGLTVIMEVVCTGEVFQEMVLLLGHTPVMVTLVPVQVLTAEDVIVGASNGLTLTP